MRSLERELQTVGHGAFIKCYDIFDRHIRGLINADQAAEEVASRLDRTLEGAYRRVNAATNIFKMGKHKEAKTIASSTLLKQEAP